jgi:hypothetical protein
VTILLAVVLAVVAITFIRTGIRQDRENRGGSYLGADLTHVIEKSGKHHLFTIGIFARN